jgi:hypothetical protein
LVGDEGGVNIAINFLIRVQDLKRLKSIERFSVEKKSSNAEEGQKRNRRSIEKGLKMMDKIPWRVDREQFET